jgi:AraC family transcriptional regulator of adaptative response/methylated-DNA-[protein]-cysteine methyltransferase
MDARDYQRIESSIRFLESSYREDPDLDALARRASLSPFHFERLFKRWAGTTPKRFAQCLRVEHAKALLASSRSVLDAAWETGLSSASRLHDLFVSLEAITPGEYKSGGVGIAIRYGRHSTPFGDALIATTERGICRLAFCDAGAATRIPSDPSGNAHGGHDSSGEPHNGSCAPLRCARNFEQELHALRAAWPHATLEAEARATAPIAARLFDSTARPVRPRFHLLVKGTNFQVQVWRALLAIPPGCAASYADVASHVGRRDAVRAVASAVAANSIAYLIPCHRVLRSTGALAGYRWGAERKRALLAWESAARSEPATR